MSRKLDINAREIPSVKLTETQEKICELIVRVATFFFRGAYGRDTVPFRGFLLEGPPGNGKTEIAKQAARRLALKGMHIILRYIDSARVARPEWGKAEEILSALFAPHSGRKMILLLDDVECLFLKRGVRIAREWHYSLNAILLRNLDDINPTSMLVIATTNRPSLIDYALRSRLYTIKVPQPSIKELIDVTKRLLEISWPLNLRNDTEIKKEILESIIKELKRRKYPSIRDVQHLVVVYCIKRGVWS